MINWFAEAVVETKSESQGNILEVGKEKDTLMCGCEKREMRERVRVMLNL